MPSTLTIARPIAISFTNKVVRPGEVAPTSYDYLERYEDVTDSLPTELCAEACYFQPEQAGSEGDGQDFDFVDPVRWNRMLMGARPGRIGVYTGLGEAKNAAGLVPGSAAFSPAALKLAVRAYRGSAYVIFDKASYPAYLARALAVARAFAEAGIRVGLEANADSPELRAFIADFPGTMIVGESWLWTAKYAKGRLSAAMVADLGGIPTALVNRRVAKQGTVGWMNVSIEDWPDMKVNLAQAFVEQGMKVLLRDSGIEQTALVGLAAAVVAG